MKTEGKDVQFFCDVSQQLRVSTWRIVEDWLEKNRLDQQLREIYSDSRADMIEGLPTLVGGIAKVIQDPMYLLDLETGGNLHSVCRNFGYFRYSTGYRIDQLINDFSSLRQELRSFCRSTFPTAEDLFFELECRLGKAIDSMAAIAIEAYHTKASAELIQLAQRDKLTGLMDFDAFQNYLVDEMARSTRYRQPLSLISIDIDGFRRFNFEEGRLQGNQLIQDIAWQIKSVIRKTDIAARFTGDEYAVILPQTALSHAKNAAERIRRSVRMLRRDDYPTTVSLGVAACSNNSADKKSLVQEARRALNEAQMEGGDIVRPIY